MIIKELSKGSTIREIVAKKIILSESDRNKGKPITVETLRILVKKITGTDRRLGPRSEKVIKRVVAAQREGWDKMVFRFLEQKPTCLACGNDLHHLSYTMLCDVCRPKRNYRIFVARNPLYNAQKWQKNKVRQTILHRRYYQTHADQINYRRRIRRREKRRRNFEDLLRFELGRLERDVRAAGL